MALVVGVTGTTGTAVAQPGFQCARTVAADVVALDQPFFYNRLGAVNPAGMVYALRGDVVVKGGTNAGKSLADLSTSTAASEAGNVELRPGKRARPLTLRMNVGDCLKIDFPRAASSRYYSLPKRTTAGRRTQTPKRTSTPSRNVTETGTARAM